MRRFLLFLPVLLFISCQNNILEIRDSFLKGINDPISANPRNSKPSDNDSDDQNRLLNSDELKILSLVNEYRKEYDLSELKIIDYGVIEARLHCEHMSNIGYLTHYGLDGRVDHISDRERITVSAYGENIGYNKNAESMFNAWINSYGHRKNIIGNYSHIGIGKFKSGSRIYYTQIFLKIKDYY